MDDLISRQEALKAVSWDTEAYMAINMLPSAQPETHACDWIDRKAAIDAFVKFSHLDWEYLKIMNPMLTILESLPSVDAVEIVRCKDCKWCVEHYDTDGNLPYWVCKNWYGGTDSDGYCHEAERKEE